ncbi:uncharacterized protein LOC122795642 [Protopterus annectens]|uniref:uncharacterized protein LOC122795642 n=1 Tax=Protopterus annectens TaxID=7888 RepID=UPI001CFAC9A6|nr:uncharacterized protein LOC122795642 [Protopterus annectens]
MTTRNQSGDSYAKARRPTHPNITGSHLSVKSSYSLLKEENQNSAPQALYRSRRSSSVGPDAERLRGENIKLKNELEDLRSQYQQLLEEGKSELFEERRVNILKAQVMQLERQVVLLTEGLSSRAVHILEVESALDSLTERLRTLLGHENHSPEVPITRTELIQMIEMCCSLRIRLQRHSQASESEKLALPWLMSGRKLTKHPLTLLDLCCGKKDNLNLQYISVLESKLSTLFRHLHAVRQTLSFILVPEQDSTEQSHHIIPPVVYARLSNHIAKCNRLLEECCHDLLILTLVVPSAPWEKLEHTVSQEFTVEDVLSALPAFPKGAPQQRAKRATEALVKAANYSRLMAIQQVDALQAELDFHRSMYNLLIKYAEALFQGIRQAYLAFQKNVAEVLCSPLQGVLTAYTTLKTTASEAALRDFLTAFKTSAQQIQDAVDALAPSKHQNEGDEALSRFAKEFFQSLERSLRDCGEQRDRAASEVTALKAEVDEALESLQNLKREKREKTAESRRHSVKFEKETMEREEGGIGEQGKDILKEKPGGGKRMPTKTGYRKQSLVSRAVPTDEAISSSHSIPLLQRDSEKSDNHRRGKGLQRSKSMKAPARPPWED